jgi:hypothetical protein
MGFVYVRNSSNRAVDRVLIACRPGRQSTHLVPAAQIGDGANGVIMVILRDSLPNASPLVLAQRFEEKRVLAQPTHKLIQLAAPVADSN